MMYHEHPVRILRYSLKNIWMLIFPLLRGLKFLRFDPAGIYAWIRGAWMDIAVLGAILLFGFVRWYFARISVTGDSIVFTQSFPVKIRTRIPFNNVSVGTSETPLYMMPFQGMIVRFDTRAGIFKSADLKLLVTKKIGTELLSNIPTVEEEKRIKDLPKPSMLSVMLFSAFFSSGFSGAVYIAVFFFKGGDIAHELISISLNRITETTEHLTQLLLLKIPQTAVLIGTFFLAAWLLSFAVNMARYFYFKVTADDDCISVACGISNRRRYQIRIDHINYIDLRQNLIMKMIGAVTVNISCAGYGCDSQKLPVLLPIRRERDLGSGLEKMGITTVGKMDYSPRKTSWFSYVGYPIIGLNAVFLLGHFMDRFIAEISRYSSLIPQLSELSGFITFMLSIPFVWLILVKTTALFTSGISIRDERVIIRSSLWTAFHTVIGGKRDVVQVEVRQSVFSKPWKKCDVVLWFGGEAKSCYIVRSLHINDARKIEREINSL